MPVSSKLTQDRIKEGEADWKWGGGGELQTERGCRKKNTKCEKERLLRLRDSGE